MGRGGIPDRWLDYSKIGQQIKSKEFFSRFIAFKVPLKPQLTSSLNKKKVFTPSDLLSICEEKQLKIGLIIDLTFTKRYYNTEDFTNAGIQYAKIPVEGQMVPKKARMQKFTETVNEFLKNTEDKDSLIGVHCTHGVNRTGYMICRYLVDNDGLDGEEAIKLFNSCRGHEIERDTYTNHIITDKLPSGEETSYLDTEYAAMHWGKKTTDTNNTGNQHDRRSNYYNSSYDNDRRDSQYSDYHSHNYNPYQQHRYYNHDHRHSYHDQQLHTGAYNSSYWGNSSAYDPHYNWPQNEASNSRYHSGSQGYSRGQDQSGWRDSQPRHSSRRKRSSNDRSAPTVKPKHSREDDF